MSDITTNAVVVNPRPIFTDSRTFRAVANGKIYVGKIDTDPTIPSNQIPVYLENENGDKVQILNHSMLRLANTPRGSTAFEKALSNVQNVVNSFVQSSKSEDLSE